MLRFCVPRIFFSITQSLFVLNMFLLFVKTTHDFRPPPGHRSVSTFAPSKVDFLKRSKVASRDSLMSRMWMVFEHPVRYVFCELNVYFFEKLRDGFEGGGNMCMFCIYQIDIVSLDRD